ncbi:MAG: branched-chain amino acid ABC transporter permease [Eubacteriaceae bacterium]|nr:branched-chain amino acid ABC transporter permease [Eubacteriaceae bacterium]
MFKAKNIAAVALLAAVYTAIKILRLTGIFGSYHEITIAQICINMLLACSLNLITGFAGQFSLGHAGFMSIGAYACALIIIRFPSVYGFMLGLIAGSLASAVVGLAIGIPTLRLSGDYLAIATLGMAEIIKVVFFNLKITNGAAGLMNIPRLMNWEWMFCLTAGSVALINNFINSRHGRACMSIREDEIASQSVGIDIALYKIAAFAIGAFFAGISGGMYAAYFYVLKPGIFGLLKSIDILVIVVLGGLGSISGSIIGAALLTLISALLQDFASLRMIIYALMLIAIMMFRPQGLLGTNEISFALFTRALKRESAK